MRAWLVITVLLSSCGGRVAGAPRPKGAAIEEPHAVADGDLDGDGIADVVDRCPHDPEDRDGFQDDDGCPDPDNDGDGIADVDDKCPNDAETFNGFEDEDGCPDRCRLYISGDPVVVSPVPFSVGASTTDASADGMIERVAGLLQARPEITLVQIEGHVASSEQGDPLALSQKRADVVRAKLIAKGIAGARLRAKGFGAHCAAASGGEAAARRVDFKVVRTTNGPTGVELGCAAATAAGIVSEPP